MNDGTPHALDPSAPSLGAEYVRYLDLDILGKIIAKNLFLNRLGYLPGAVQIPLGKFGDAKAKYKTGMVTHDLSDGHIETEQGRLSFEVKCARINIENRYRPRRHHAENWAFQGLLSAPTSKSKKSYDILIAIGMRRLGLEDDGYWGHLENTLLDLQLKKRPYAIDAWPHEAVFLSLCSFFILPLTHLRHNYFRINLKSIESSSYAAYQAWGYDEQRCRDVWQDALRVIHGDSSTTSDAVVHR